MGLPTVYLADAPALNIGLHLLYKVFAFITSFILENTDPYQAKRYSLYNVNIPNVITGLRRLSLSLTPCLIN